MQQSWGFRVARAGMFAATSVLLAALGHVLMSGAAIPWWALAMCFGWIGLTAWIVADRERGVPFVVLGTLVIQAALHTVFSMTQSLVRPEPAGLPSDLHPMAHDAMPMAAATDPAAHHLTGAGSIGMLVAHLLAALLCGLWLAYGERAAFAILRFVAGQLRLSLRLPARPRLTEHLPRIRHSYSPTPLRNWLLAHAIVSRGPPRGTAVS
ncbi:MULTISPECIES: hypothetical protein [unclassified Kribbella]|uniref:hypothetical protein n=1 Tax=unclassified Kribbella TaxID=2644121 RepID=UPI0033C2A5F2